MAGKSKATAPHFYLQAEIEEAKGLARDLRNVATHGSDDTLLNLGYPPDQKRVLRAGHERTGHELSLAEAAVAFPVIVTAVHAAARRVASQGIESGWDDDVFRGNFAPLKPAEFVIIKIAQLAGQTQTS